MPDPNRQYSASLYWVGHVATLAVVFATFASLFILYVARASNSRQFWSELELPRQLWLSSLLLIGASVSIEMGRRALRNGALNQYSVWLIRTAVAGFAFVIAQLLSWRMMMSQVSMPHDSNRAMFYVLTGAHALHVLAGMAALGYLIWRVWNPWNDRADNRRSSITFMLATYWHAMLLIWLILYALLAGYSK